MQGVTRIKVVNESAQLPGVILNGSPPAAKSSSLQDVMTALGVDPANNMDTLHELWLKNAGGKPKPPRLRKRRAASFLIVSAAPEGRIDFEHSMLESVWLDGHK